MALPSLITIFLYTLIIFFAGRAESDPKTASSSTISGVT